LDEMKKVSVGEEDAALAAQKNLSEKEKKGSVKTHLVLPVLFIVMSVVWIYIGLTKFGYFDKMNGGTPGFLPITCAAIMLVASIAELLSLLRNGSEDEAPHFNRNCILFFLLCFGIVALSYLIGLLLSMIIFVFIWLKFVEKCSWKSTLIVLAINIAIGYGVFQLALGVPFPQGLIYTTIVYG